MSVAVSVESAAASRPVSDVLEFLAPPPGMADVRFTLDALDESGHLFALRSAERPAVRLFVVPPRAYFPRYSPALDAAALRALDVEGAEAVLLVVVHPGHDGEPPTANLLAPLVLNPTTGRAVQLVLDGDEWPLRAPLGATGSAA